MPVDPLDPLDLDDLGEPTRPGVLFDLRSRADGLAVISPGLDRDRLLFAMRERRHRLAEQRADRLTDRHAGHDTG